MAKSTEATLFPIEQLRAKHKTPPAVFAGTKAMKGWAAGKCVAEAEYRAAVDRFLKKAGG